MLLLVISQSFLFYSEIPSALPYVGACLEQIYCLDIGVKTYNNDGLVNFAKMTKVSESHVHTILATSSSAKIYNY